MVRSSVYVNTYFIYSLSLPTYKNTTIHSGSNTRVELPDRCVTNLEARTSGLDRVLRHSHIQDVATGAGNVYLCPK